MKCKFTARSVACGLFLLLGIVQAFGQIKSGGEVVELIDARTVAVATPTGRVTVELQYIEVPEPEQPLHAVVKDHLKNLLHGKVVEFHPKGILPGKAVGQLFLNGVDMSRQMLRDGAAWHVPITVSGQEKVEFDLYAAEEALAKQENRGVWSIEGLKPAWEVRAENTEKLRQKEIAEYQRIAKHSTAVGSVQTPGRPRAQAGNQSASSNLETWADVYAGVGRESVGLGTHYDPNRKLGTIYTSLAFVNLISGTKKQKLEARAMQAYIDKPGGRETAYLLGFQAISEDFNFSKRKSRLTVIADKQRITLGSPRGIYGQMVYGVHEIFYYKISRQSLTKMANAKNVEIRIDGYAAVWGEDSRQLIKQLLAATD